jgi:hypothetical protein
MRPVPWMAAALGVLSARSAFAFPSSRLVYSRDQGAERCPDEEMVRREVASRLGYDPFFPTADRVIVAQVAPSAKGFRATVDLLDKAGIVRGRRELRSPGRDCAELLKSIALAISIAIDPDAVDTRQPAADADTSSAEIFVAPPIPAQPAKQPRALPLTAKSEPPPEPLDVTPSHFTRGLNDDGGWALVVGAGARVASGVAPSTSSGGTLLFGANWRWLALLLEATADLPASNEVVSTNLFATSLLVCGQTHLLFGCAISSLGTLFANAQRGDRAGYAAVGARAGLSIPLGRLLAIRVYLEADVPIGWRDTTLALNGSEVWRLPAYSGAAGTQVVMRFP